MVEMSARAKYDGPGYCSQAARQFLFLALAAQPLPLRKQLNPLYLFWCQTGVVEGCVSEIGRTPSDSASQIDSLANSDAEPQIAARRSPQTIGRNLWSNVTL